MSLVQDLINSNENIVEDLENTVSDTQNDEILSETEISKSDELQKIENIDSDTAETPKKSKKLKLSKGQMRRNSRIEAFILVFEKSFRTAKISELIGIDPEREQPDEYLLNVLALLDERLPEIDDIISKRSKKWEISRLSKVTVSILRLALAEILANSEPHAVIVNEAVELAKIYASNEDASYINGILGGYLRDEERNNTEKTADDNISPENTDNN